MQVRKHNLRLLDDAREVGPQQHPGSEKQDSQHILNQPTQCVPDITIGAKILGRHVCRTKLPPKNF